ncbi:MAG: protein kinase [Gemmatimonadaceae bacterium]
MKRQHAEGSAAGALRDDVAGGFRDRLESAVGDRYTIERELGRGGAAIVYLAEDRKHHRHVAIKLLNPELAQALGAERFLREIEIAARLSHPNILPLYDSGAGDGLLYYVMPFIEGESLRERLAREKQLSLEDAVQVARQVAEALAYAHAQGVVHRDIKPANILLHAGQAMVSDFGIARALDVAGGDRLTQSGLAVGTPAYMSPEQAAGADDVDARSDVYALGCVLYEMLAGAPPFTGPTPQAVLARKAVEPVPKLRVVRDTVPAELEAVIEKALARVPADRFATARGLADALSGSGRPLKRTATSGLRARISAGWIAAFVLAAAIVATGAYSIFAGDVTRRGGPVRATFAQLTGHPGLEWYPSLSPDGRWVVYSGEAAGNRDIYLQSVGGQTPINLTGDSPADDVQPVFSPDGPVFSPDGERIAFRSSRDGGGIFVMGRTGEAVKRVTRNGFNPAWSPDGSHLAYASEGVELNPMNWDGVSELWVATVATGETRRLDVPNAAQSAQAQSGRSARGAVQAVWSPSGRRIAFVARLADKRKMDIWTIPAGGGTPVPATNDEPVDWNPVWSPDGKFLYFASDRGGSMNLWRVAIDEETGATRGEPEPITTPAPFVGHLSISGDGRRIAYASVLLNMNVQRLTLDPVTATVKGEPFYVTTGSRSWANPDVSPDGEWIVFYSRVGPEGDIYVVRADGTGLRQVTSDSAIDRVPRWSTDGKWISHFSDRSGGNFQLWAVRPDGSELRQLTDIGGVYAAWSPDGRRVATTAVANAANRLVYIFDPNLPPGESNRQVLTNVNDARGGFVVTSWSRDGNLIAGQVGVPGKGIAVYDLRTGTFQRVADFGEWPVWLPDSRRLLFVARGKEFHVADTRTREVRKIWSVSRDVIGPPRLTRDGRAMYFSRRVSESDVWLLTMTMR